jgi:hypothetical protein
MFGESLGGQGREYQVLREKYLNYKKIQFKLIW